MDYYIKHQNATILYQFGIEVELVAGGDTHLIELSHTQTLVGFDQHLGVYLGRAELGTGNIVIAFLPVDDDLHLLSYQLMALQQDISAEIEAEKVDRCRRLQHYIFNQSTAWSSAQVHGTSP